MPANARWVLGMMVGGVAGAVVLYELHRRRTMLRRNAMRARLAEIMSGRVPLKKGTLSSETSDERINLPASLLADGRLQLGDLGHVADLLEGDSDNLAYLDHLKAHPVSAVLVCMGADAAATVSKEFKKKKLTYLGLEGCVDQEGYPLIELHLAAARTFIREQLAAAAPDGCVLVHCHEGKNRSAALCTAYLMVEERMPLTRAIEVLRSSCAHRAPPTNCPARVRALTHVPCLRSVPSAIAARVESASNRAGQPIVP
jgi:predicted protein tyrosine phosphatase